MTYLFKTGYKTMSKQERKQLNMSLSYKDYTKLVAKYKSYVRKCVDKPEQFAAWARNELLGSM